MTVLALTWPETVVASVAIAAVGLILAIVAWQVFEIVIKDDRRTERELRLRQPRQ